MSGMLIPILYIFSFKSDTPYVLIIYAAYLPYALRLYKSYIY